MNSAASLSDGLLIAFYGDDYTGSSAVMEVLTFAGLPTVLFLETPTQEQLSQFGSYRAMGIAGVARSQSPDWMDLNLPPIFRWLESIGAPIAHYKVCSTFDSAPHVGSIGRAADLGRPILGGVWHPLVVAAPKMGRYQAFGNLFATVDGAGYRLDRHPTMTRHPVTPMDEADVRLHLGRQTAQAVGLVDFVQMKRGLGDASLERNLAAGSEIVALDIIDNETLAEAGRIIWQNRGKRLFAIGSQGLEYALVAHWKAAGLLEDPPHAFLAPSVSRIICVSGSCSPVTASQIAYAEQHGFEAIPIDARFAVNATEWKAEVGRATERALAYLSAGRDPLVYTAAGPDDPSVAALKMAVETSGSDLSVVHHRIGEGLGRLLDAVLREAKLVRAIIAGGDTSGHATQQLGVYALTALAPIAPGSPLCEAHRVSQDSARLEIALKGGQVGAPDFFCAVKNGGRL
jgi:3-oxoisoapionate kinase